MQFRFLYMNSNIFNFIFMIITVSHLEDTFREAVCFDLHDCTFQIIWLECPVKFNYLRMTYSKKV